MGAREGVLHLLPSHDMGAQVRMAARQGAGRAEGNRLADTGCACEPTPVTVSRATADARALGAYDGHHQLEGAT